MPYQGFGYCNGFNKLKFIWLEFFVILDSHYSGMSVLWAAKLTGFKVPEYPNDNRTFLRKCYEPLLHFMLLSIILININGCLQLSSYCNSSLISKKRMNPLWWQLNLRCLDASMILKYTDICFCFKNLQAKSTYFYALESPVCDFPWVYRFLYFFALYIGQFCLCSV